MCLMQTDLPVPDGPRIIEILSSGMRQFRPRRILLRPNALWTSLNSIANGPVGSWVCTGVVRVLVGFQARIGLAHGVAVGACGLGCDGRRGGRRASWHPRSGVPSTLARGAGRPSLEPSVLGAAGSRGGSAESSGRIGSATRHLGSVASRPWSASDRGARVGSPEDLGDEHADHVHEHDVRRPSTWPSPCRRRPGRRWRCSRRSSRPARSRWPSSMPLVRLKRRSGGFWNMPEEQEIAAGRHLADLLDDRDVGAEEARRRSPRGRGTAARSRRPAASSSTGTSASRRP